MIKVFKKGRIYEAEWDRGDDLLEMIEVYFPGFIEGWGYEIYEGGIDARIRPLMCGYCACFEEKCEHEDREGEEVIECMLEKVRAKKKAMFYEDSLTPWINKPSLS